MKAELNLNTDDLVSQITQEVIRQLKPLLNSHDKGNELMTVEELAAYLKMKKSSIYDKVHSRIIPFLKNGSSLRFRKKHIDLWLLNPYHPDLSIYNLNYDGRR